MHKLRHGGFNTRKDKKVPLLHHQYSRDKLGGQAADSIIKPQHIWKQRELLFSLVFRHTASNLLQMTGILVRNYARWLRWHRYSESPGGNYGCLEPKMKAGKVAACVWSSNFIQTEDEAVSDDQA